MAEDKQSVGRAGAADEDDGNGGHDGDEPRQQPPGHGIELYVDETFHDDLTGEGGGQGRVQAAGNERDGKKLGGERAAEQWRDQPVGIRQFGDLRVTVRVERGCGEDQNGAVDQQREKQRDRRIEDREADGGRFFGVAWTDRARQHNARMQIEIMRHDRRAQDPERDIEHRGICDQVAGGQERLGDIRHVWPGKHKLDREAGRDQDEKRDDEGFELAEAEAREGEDEQSVERGQNNTGAERQAGQQLKSDRGADDFGEVGGDDRQLHDQPKPQPHGAGKGLAAVLGEIAPGRESEPRRKRL